MGLKASMHILPTSRGGIVGTLGLLGQEGLIQNQSKAEKKVDKIKRCFFC